MSIFLMSLTILIYVNLVYFCSKRLEKQLSFEPEKNQFLVDKAYTALAEEYKDLIQTKKRLENESIEKLTLYEMTREITTSLHAQNAFKIFKNKLEKHVYFTSCELLNANSKEAIALRKKDKDSIFTLKGKKKNIGFLHTTGLKPEEQETFIVLAQQFALALRRVKLYQEIERVAITDGLTELYTRRYTLERFQEELDRSKLHKINLSFIMVDVDYFKKFNDNYGHIAGDQILCEIARIIKDNIREIDVGGRYGGEEFCVVLPDTDREGALFAAERIRKSTEKAIIKAYDTTVKATVSIGLATFPNDGKSTMELMDKADWALYRAKKNGRNKVCSFGVYEDGSDTESK